jgi:hypothetical protein
MRFSIWIQGQDDSDDFVGRGGIEPGNADCQKKTPVAGMVVE